MFKSVRGRIILIIVVIFVLFGAAVFFNIFSLAKSNDGLGSYRDLSEVTNQISEIESNFFGAALAFKDYVVNYDEQTKETFTQNINTVQ
ncbi:MAG: Methyl-accepting chemotaxis sensory transducer, partial [Petrotoga mobilis]